MERTIQLYGHIDRNGNPMVSGNERLIEYFKHWAGHRYIIEIISIDNGTTNHHVWYIMKMIVPAFIRGYKENGSLITPQEALQNIIDCCPIFCKTHNEKHTIFDWVKYEPKCEMDSMELEVAIEWLHIYCLENFDIAIGNFKSIKS